jgi:ABC-type multidrug transport system fused ATPase/permease subunit
MLSNLLGSWLTGCRSAWHFLLHLLDDCLTHLDVLVGDYVFEKSIKQFLKDKLVVLVTQNPKHVSPADGIIVLKNQRVKFGGCSGRT